MGLLNALKLGSTAEYPRGSLSKYGMGLKSAGFSLGTRIEVISRRDGNFTLLHYVDHGEITTQYVVSRRKLAADEEHEADFLLESAQTGTIVRVFGGDTFVLQSASSTVRKLEEQLGVVYHDFLAHESSPLCITVSCTDKPTVVVQPLDILFRENAVQGFDPDTCDCKSPCLVLSKKVVILDDEEKISLLEVVLFPKPQLSKYAGFTEDERKQLKSSKVSRANKGFFIYRNDRLIRWGDDLDGLIGKDRLLFRARCALFHLWADHPGPGTSDRPAGTPSQRECRGKTAALHQPECAAPVSPLRCSRHRREKSCSGGYCRYSGCLPSLEDTHKYDVSISYYALCVPGSCSCGVGNFCSGGCDHNR